MTEGETREQKLTRLRRQVYTLSASRGFVLLGLDAVRWKMMQDEIEELERGAGQD